MRIVYSSTAAALGLFSRVSAHGANAIPPARQWQCSGGASPNMNVGWNGVGGARVCSPDVTGSDINNVITDWSGVSVKHITGAWSSSFAYQESPIQPHIDAMGETTPICNAGMSKYIALDQTVWTVDQGDSDFDYPYHMKNGPNTFHYSCSGSHRTTGRGYVDVYITKDGWDMSKNPDWSDLDQTPICHWVPESYPSGLQSGQGEDYPCTIPTNKVGQHIIFTIWVRDDEEEAVYACSDVVLEGIETTTSTTTTTTASTTTTGTPCGGVFRGPVRPDGTIRPFGEDSSMCMFSPGDDDLSAGFGHSGLAYIASCNVEDSRFFWSYDMYTEMVADRSGKCLTISSEVAYGPLAMEDCIQWDIAQKFFWNQGQLHSILNYDMCIGYDENEFSEHGYHLTTMPCAINLFGAYEN